MQSALVEVLPVERIVRHEYVQRIRKDGTAMQGVWMRGQYDAASKRFSLVSVDAMSREIFVKRGTLLHVGFTY